MFSNVFPQYLHETTDEITDETTDVYFSIENERFFTNRHSVITHKSFNYTNVLSLICSTDSSLAEPQMKHKTISSFNSCIFQESCLYPNTYFIPIKTFHILSSNVAAVANRR